MRHTHARPKPIAKKEMVVIATDITPAHAIYQDNCVRILRVSTLDITHSYMIPPSAGWSYRQIMPINHMNPSHMNQKVLP
jgi:hypothetical protein